MSDDRTEGRRRPAPDTPRDSGGDRPATTTDTPLHSSELPDSVTCPFCDGHDTEQFSAFGGQVSTSQYYCSHCRTVFDCFRWR